MSEGEATPERRGGVKRDGTMCVSPCVHYGQPGSGTRSTLEGARPGWRMLTAAHADRSMHMMGLRPTMHARTADAHACMMLPCL